MIGRSGAFVCGLKMAPGSVRSSIGAGSVSTIGGSRATGCIDAVAVTANAPVDWTVVVPVVASEATTAFVETSKRLTTSAPPIAASPLASAPAIARFCDPRRAIAVTDAGPVEVIVAPRPIFARVTRSTSWTPIEPATANAESPVPIFGACESPPAAASPREMKSFCCPSGVIASTVTPWPVTVAPAPISAVFEALNSFSPTAAPTLRSHSSSQSAVPSACADASRCAVAVTLTSPAVAVTESSSRIRARFWARNQLTAKAAATPTLPPEAPDSDCDWPFAWSAVSDALGRFPPVCPAVCGLVWTCEFAFASASSSSGSVPFALAVAVAELFTLEAATTFTESAVMLRASSALVLQSSTTLMARSAPTAASSPTASALAFVCV